MIVEIAIEPFLPEEVAVESPENEDGNEGNEDCPSDWSRLLGEQSERGGGEEDAPLFEAEGVVGESTDGLLDEFEVFDFVFHRFRRVLSCLGLLFFVFVVVWVGVLGGFEEFVGGFFAEFFFHLFLFFGGDFLFFEHSFFGGVFAFGIGSGAGAEFPSLFDFGHEGAAEFVLVAALELEGFVFFLFGPPVNDLASFGAIGVVVGDVAEFPFAVKAAGGDSVFEFFEVSVVSFRHRF